MNSKTLPTVAIIGSGFSGIAAFYHLQKELNITPQLFEATNDIGGTWNYNTYPGCACDVMSHLYSFSFEMNPDWSEKYSPRKEIHEYMKTVAKKYKVYEHTQFDTEVVRTSWIEHRNQWELELKIKGEKQNEIMYFDFIFSCVGVLRVPHVPMEFQTFEGKVIHSAYWDSSYDFSNKNVGIIGSGTSAVQIIPKMIDSVGHLYSFQRTPAWISQKKNGKYSKLLKLIFRYVPFILYVYRCFIYIRSDLRFPIWGNVNSRLAKMARKASEDYLVSTLKAKKREDLIPKLMPSFNVGCKRIGFSDDYVPALCSSNVSVTNSPIKSIEGNVITTEDGERTNLDALILATGFDVTGFLGNLKVYGKNNLNLNDLWDKELAKTYKTVTIHGFPNFFLMLGPGSILGHSSVVTMAELQILAGIKQMKYQIKHKIKSMDPKKDSQETFSNKLQKGFKGTTWASGCRSWYLNQRGEIQALWPWSVTWFWWMLRSTNYRAHYNKSA
ncbi:FAD/NAD(P)-binding domain-containing protein [Backusella circina FSU 941]|nr:FAD/NAD(P)-binding domain-containing protein [Backusella circina FSU 941]